MGSSATGENSIIQHRPRLLLIIVAFFILLPGTGILPLIDRDEPRFAQATREMMERDEWIVPYFNDKYRFDKPILTYWLMRVNYWIFGVNEFGARFHSVLATIGTALLIFQLGKSIHSTLAGFWAGFMWLTCLQVWIHGRLSLADMPMVMAVTATHWALYELLVKQKDKHWLWFWVLYGSLGLGFLAKGPIAWFCPVFTLFLFRFALHRQPLPWRNLHLGLGIPIVLLIVGSWGIPALIKTQGQFWQVGIKHHVIERGTEAFHGRIIFPGYYFLTALFSLFPWVAFLGVMIKTVREKWDITQAFLISWLAAPYIIFSFYATQLPHYVLPGFPAFFLLLSPVMTEKIQLTFIGRLWKECVSYLFLMTFLLILLIKMNSQWIGTTHNPFSILLNIDMVLFSYFLLPNLLNSNIKHIMVYLLAFIIMTSSYMLSQRMHHTSLSIQINEFTVQDAHYNILIDSVYKEPSMVFYGNRRWQFFSSQDEAMKEFLQHETAIWIYAKDEWKLEDVLKQIMLGHEPDQKQIIFADELFKDTEVVYTTKTVEGFNPARASWVKLHIVIRTRENAA